MRSLVLMLAFTLAPVLKAQDRFIYGALPAYSNPQQSLYYFDNGFYPSTGNTYQQLSGNNRFPSSQPSFDYGLPQQYASNTLVPPFASSNDQLSNAFTSFQQTLGPSPFAFPQTSSGYQQPNPYEEFGRFVGNEQFSPYGSPFPGYPQNIQGFGVNRRPVAPPQFGFPTASNQPFGRSPFRNIPTQANQLPTRPQFPNQQPQQPFQNNNPFTQPQPQPQPQPQSQFPNQQPFQSSNPFTQPQKFPTNNPFQQQQTVFPPTTATEVPQPIPTSQGNQLRPIKGIFGPGQPGQFDAPKEYVIPL